MNIFSKRSAHLLQDRDKKLRRTIFAAGIVSLAAYVTLFIFAEKRILSYSNEMTEAARIMEQATSVVRDYCKQSGIEIDSSIDPNQTGLVGPEYTELTTTVGHLEAKRTTTNPNIAALVVHLLYQAEAEPGDTVAVGCSASFPALMVASLSAAKAMDLHPSVIISLGASSYGGTKPDFNLLDIYDLLLDKGIFAVPPAAISLGGEQDVGGNYEPELKERLIQQIQSSELHFIYEPNLQKNVAIRTNIYKTNAPQGRISAFINTGGSYANLGTSKLALTVKPGLNKKIPTPPVEKRGVLFEMAAQEIPIIHLLYIKGLAMKYNLPWDPTPLPKSGETEFYDGQVRNTIQFWLITILYFVALIFLFAYHYLVKRNKN